MTHDDPARAGIDAANRRFEAAFNAGDPAGAARAVYTREARVLPPDLPMVRGRDAIADFWIGAAQQFGVKTVRLSTQELDVHGEAAHEVGEATLALADGEARAKYVVLWKREADEWRWDVDIWNFGV